MAPMRSMALWNPKAFPLMDGWIDVELSASRDGVPAALPILSENRITTTETQLPAM